MYVTACICRGFKRNINATIMGSHVVVWLFFSAGVAIKPRTNANMAIPVRR